VLHKKVCNPKVRQPGLLTEEELTEVTDISDSCFCQFEPAPGVPGVGVIDLFCFDVSDHPFFWGDHVLKITAHKGDAEGSEIQDLCILSGSKLLALSCAISWRLSMSIRLQGPKFRL